MMSLLAALIAALGVELSSDTLMQGEICYVRISTAQQGLLSLEYDDESYPLLNEGDGFYALIPTSYGTRPGSKSMIISLYIGADTQVVDTSVYVASRDFRKSVISLPATKQHAIDTSMQKRKQEEYRLVVDAINAPSVEYFSIFPEFYPCQKRISGTYGDERWSGGRKLWHHSGLDFAVPQGTPIIAPSPGKVIMAADTFIRQGSFVILDHGAGLKTVYYHMLGRAVEEGEEVAAGDTLGLVGSTGLATGPHLHLGVYINGVPVDPGFWLAKKEWYNP